MEITRRANLANGNTQDKRVYRGRYALSGMVFYAHCGDIFRRIKWNNRGCRSTVWRCLSRVEKDGPDCLARTVHEEILHEVVIKAINEAFHEKEDILPILRENIESGLAEDDADMKNSADNLGMEVRRLRNEKQTIQDEEASNQNQKARIDEMMTFLEGLSRELTEYNEQYVRTLLEKITIYDDYFTVFHEESISFILSFGCFKIFD